MPRLNCSPVPLPDIGVILSECVGHVLPLPRDNLDDSNDKSSASSFGVFTADYDKRPSTTTQSQEKRTDGPMQGRDLMKVKKKQHMQYLKSRLQSKNELEIKQFKYTYKHYLFFDILQDGFHATHAVLFDMINQQAERIKLGHPEPPLETQGDLMCIMGRYLMQIETASRTKDYRVVYEQNVLLAEFIIDRDPQKHYVWISDRFYYDSMTAAVAYGFPDGGLILAEASMNVGTVFESHGMLVEAAEQFEHYRELTADNEVWLVPGKGRELDPNDVRLMANDSCIRLGRVYEKLALIAADDQDFETCYQYYIKVYNSVQKGGGRKRFLEATRNLAYAAVMNDDTDTALQHLHRLLDSYCVDEDREGVTKTLEVIGMSYKSLRDVDSCVAYYAEFAAMSEEIDDYEAVKRACNETGHLYTITGQYDVAAGYFMKGFSVYEPAINCSEISTIQRSRVLLGIGLGHQILHTYREHVYQSTGPCMERLFDWKDTRHNEFTRDIPNKMPSISREKRRRDHFRHEYEQILEERERAQATQRAKLRRKSQPSVHASSPTPPTAPKPTSANTSGGLIRLSSAEINEAFRRKSLNARRNNH